MKRLDVNVTDSINGVLDNLKRKTERSKTELIHDAVGLLWLAEKTYAQGHAFAEVDRDGTVVSRFHMPMFERLHEEPVGVERPGVAEAVAMIAKRSQEEPVEEEWAEAVAVIAKLMENSLSSMEHESSVPAAAVKVRGQDLSSRLGVWMERARAVEQGQVHAG